MSGGSFSVSISGRCPSFAPSRSLLIPARGCEGKSFSKSSNPTKQHRSSAGSNLICRCAASLDLQSVGVQSPRVFPDFIPKKELQEIDEEAALDMMAAMRRIPISHPSMGEVSTAYVGPDTWPHPQAPSTPWPPILLLHGFDGSLLEFRRLYPLLAERRPTWAVDLAGWGFTDCGFGKSQNQELGPDQKREHLYAFWKAKIQRPMILMGASLGGTIAIDFALAHPEAVEKLVLLDAQGFVDGIGPLSTMPRIVSWLGVQLLRTVFLRQMANKMAYFDKEQFSTDDAMKIGRLHTFLPGWTDANIAFMRSGGYSVSEKVRLVQQETLVLWGAEDEILEPAFAKRFGKELPRSRVVLLEKCGHCGHLEQPQRLANLILDF